MAIVDDRWKQHAGHPDQFVGTRMVRVLDGSGDGSRLLQAWTPAGLEIDITLDRGFDIGAARLRGVPLAWLGPSGPQPRYMQEPSEFGWLRTFQGGLLTTCGLSHVGAPTWLSNQHNLSPNDADVHHGEHGRISHQSAQLTGCAVIEDDNPRIQLTAHVREAALYAENLELRRQIDLPLYRPEILIRDQVINVGALPARHELLYHVNLGYPLVSEGAMVRANSSGTVRSEKVAALTRDATEKVDAWAITPSEDNVATIQLTSPEFGGTLDFDYSSDTLPDFLLWKLQRTKNNVLGFAPRSAVETFLEPDQTVDYKARFSFTTDGTGSR